MGVAEIYLIIINIIGFVLYLINMLLYNYTAEANVDKFLTIISLVGGSLGILLAIVLFDRKSVKDNMMSRVFVICLFVIQLVMFLFLKGANGEKITFAFWEFFAEHKILIIYSVIINFVSFAAFAVDKINACEGRSRIRMITLLGIAFAGGSIGAILGMYIFRHKTRVDYFTVGVPLIMIMQAVVIFYLMNL
jgi:uncharacterized membrane protein YsdA (DUF1294 family)